MKLEWKSCLKIGVTVGVLYLFIQYWSLIASGMGLVFHAASPLIIGFVIAYAVNILMSFYEKYYFPKAKNKWILKSRRAVCLLFAYLSLIGIIALIIGLIVPELVNCVKLLLEKIPPAMERLAEKLGTNTEWGVYFDNALSMTKRGDVDWKELANKAANWVVGGVGGAMGAVGNVITATFSTTFNIIMSIIFSIYLLAGKKKILDQVNRVAKAYMSEKLYNRTVYVCSTLNESFHNFIVGQCLEAVILGSLCAIGLLILRMPYAGMLGALIGFTALIPVAGAYIGGAVGFFMIATISPVQALIFLVFLLVLQQVEGQLIYPKVVGESIGLPGIWVLAAVTIGGSVLGVGGMLLFVPLASAAYKLLKNDVNQRNGVMELQEETMDNEEEEVDE
nr:AI-2E family transporter [Eubacterium sp.]